MRIMIKYISAVAMALMLVANTACARDEYYPDASMLPDAAKNTLSTYFSTQQVVQVKVDRNLFGVDDYEVTLNSGTTIEFDNAGVWESIDCGYAEVPKEIVQQPISNFITKNYGGCRMLKISRDKRKYEVELNNGLELEFNLQGQFLRID